MSHFHKPALFALCITLTLTGCASAPKKPQAVTPVAGAQDKGTASDTASNSGAQGSDVQTGALSGNDTPESRELAARQEAARLAAERQQQAEREQQMRLDEEKRKAAAQVALLSTRLVHFDFDSADLQSADYQTLLAHAQYLAKTPAARVLLSGHADERGTREYNLALGEKRARSVEAFLNSNGARSEQLETVSLGKEEPLNDGHDEAAWAENRRVEISYKSNDPTGKP